MFLRSVSVFRADDWLETVLLTSSDSAWKERQQQEKKTAETEIPQLPKPGEAAAVPDGPGAPYPFSLVPGLFEVASGQRGQPRPRDPRRGKDSCGQTDPVQGMYVRTRTGTRAHVHTRDGAEQLQPRG
ncbi:hypothetical protein EYF80_015464 [Liparis tanakae]|uniref:Uncharacterized protein n=1 Tax=Liparis tanakae TaxID=230148 RepID=A0A4Z2I8Z7_9TELE|nr:hypothetical protein EYF80_015464 [Liparis tanakae]